MDDSGGPKLGLLLPYSEGRITSRSFLRRFIERSEELGIESLWAVEHVIVAESYEPRYPYSSDGRMPSAAGLVPMPDPLELLSFAAALSERLVLGTCVVVAPLHSPVVLAKRAATLSRLSEGRFRLGLGIGWQIEEYAAVGASFDARGAQLEEGIVAMRTLWSQRPATFEGRFTSFDQVHLTPPPLGGSVPIFVGGNSSKAIERAGRLGDGWFPYTIGPEAFAEGVGAVRRSALDAGRSNDAVEFTVWPGSYDPRRGNDGDLGAAYVDAGADRLILRPEVGGDTSLVALADQVTRYRDELGANLW